MVVSRDVAGLLDAELLELPPEELLPEEETVAEPPAPVDTAVQTPKLVVPVTALVEGYRDAQTGLDFKDASKLDIAASWLLRAGSLALAHEAAAEE